jgi:conjugal transfer pilus assembly protein TraE
MELDPANLTSEVTGELSTIVGSKVVNRQRKTFRFTWKYSGVTLQLVGFGMVTKEKEKDQ